MRRQSGLILVQEGTKQQTRRRGKVFTTGSVYTHANKGHAYWMSREDWPEETRPIPRRLPPYLIPLHGATLHQSMVHRATMAAMTRGRGFREA